MTVATKRYLNSIRSTGKGSIAQSVVLVVIFATVAEAACGHGVVRIKWPHPGLVQPILLASDGVRVSIAGLQEGKSYHAYLQVVQNQARQIYKEFVWSEGYEHVFDVQLLPDGKLELRVQVFGSDGCLEGSASVEATVRRDMGLQNPACENCLFTTGWASTHFSDWESFFFDSQLAPLPKSIDILEIGSWEGMSAIWLYRRLEARTITCVDTWKGGVDQGGSFAESVLPGHLLCCSS